eukprot:CAMPEP_0202867836 /NCGR_PEP_ID=MMETSP1391-20130828/9650_1 /ASSEMBLY_ACC=CAM_ASM_000867 /TAXON_ID=1034604 /ORGANISM="Chlamydomonas leiostraca, Strain SAG 11-49" /LENGTH=216 /DNA_ID=CAMNT_0049547913 /DNA_START=16 /DNA_END=666 /DNA_ORIENTATION=-
MTALNPTNMQLRSGAVVGSHLLPPQARPAFEEGTRLLFARWTALTLAVENQWGGANSAEKAHWLLQETIQWFYKNKEHYADDLEEELDDALLHDFNVEAEDNSPGELSKALVSLYQECMQGNFNTVHQLQAAAAAAAAASGAAKSKRQVVDRDGTIMGEDSGNEDSSSDEGDDDMDEDMAGPSGMQQQQPKEPEGPIVDEDGFTLVQKAGKGKGRR